MYKSIAITLPKNILIKIKYLTSNKFLIWFFGPLGIIKTVINKVDFIIDYYRLLVLVFKKSSIYYIKNKTSYCESVAHLFKFSLFNNNKGYTCFMRLKGVGYKIEQKKSDSLLISLGYSHKLNIQIPSFIKVCILKKRTILWSYSLSRLQQFCFILTKLKTKDPYNGKGIFQPHLYKKLKIGKVSRV